jgi:membrane protease YdiL (CAAX protease family)
MWPYSPRAGWPPPAPPASTWPIGHVPWGHVKPPPAELTLQPPGRFHPPSPARALLSLGNRAAPRLYMLGLLLGVPGIAALLALVLASDVDTKVAFASASPALILEIVCLVASVGLVAAALAQGRQRRADGWTDFAGPSPFLLILAQQAVVTALGLPIAALLVSAGIGTDSATGTLLLIPAYLVAYFGLVYVAVVRPGAMTWRDVVFPRRLAPDPDRWTVADIPPRNPAAPGSRWQLPRGATDGLVGDALVGLAILIPVLIASGLLDQALVAVLGLDPRDLAQEVPGGPLSTLDRLFTLLSVAILIPIGEEIFFRGFATNAWGRSLGRGSTILRAGLFFAFVHVVNVQPDTDATILLKAAIFNFAARVPVGLALCWIYLRRRSLVASVTLHGSYNGLIVLLTFLLA